MIHGGCRESETVIKSKRIENRKLVLILATDSNGIFNSTIGKRVAAFRISCNYLK